MEFSVALVSKASRMYCKENTDVKGIFKYLIIIFYKKNSILLPSQIFLMKYKLDH